MALGASGCFGLWIATLSASPRCCDFFGRLKYIRARQQSLSHNDDVSFRFALLGCFVREQLLAAAVTELRRRRS